MRVPVGEWAKVPEFQNILYFVQRADEMHWNLVADSYRKPLLNTPLCAINAHETLEDIVNFSLSERIADPVISELCDFISRDFVVKKCFSGDAHRLMAVLKDRGQSIKAIARSISHFIRKLEYGYLENAIEMTLDEVVGSRPHHDNLEALARAIFPDISGRGYAREHVYHLINKMFMEGEVADPHAALSDLFSQFLQSDRDFNVVAKIDNKMLRALQNADVNYKECGPEGIPDFSEYKARFLRLDDGYRLISISVVASDNHSARRVVEFLLHSVRSVGNMAYPSDEMQWAKPMHVHEIGTEQCAVLHPPMHPLRRRRTVANIASELIRERWDLINSGLSPKDRVQLVRCNKLHDNAFSSFNAEDQLVSLWSALEALLPQPTGGTRIGSFLENILPCQTMGYIKKLLTWVFIDVEEAFGREVVDRVKSVERYAKAKDKFIAAIMLKECDKERRSLGEMCEFNPLARKRMYELYKMSNDVNILFGAIMSHRQRVEWQVHRVYRYRNAVVHKGAAPATTPDIITNLHEYFYNVLDYAAHAKESASYDGSIDSWFYQIRADEGDYLDVIRAERGAPVNEKNISDVLNVMLEQSDSA